MSTTIESKLRSLLRMQPIIRTRDLARLGLPRTTLEAALVEGKIARLSHGIYAVSGFDVSESTKCRRLGAATSADARPSQELGVQPAPHSLRRRAPALPSCGLAPWRTIPTQGRHALHVWEGAPHRASKDLDLLGLRRRSPNELVEIFRQVLATPVEPDGLVFRKISAEPIWAAMEVGGIRAIVRAELAAARSTELPKGPVTALTMEFAEDAGKRTQWNVFVRQAAVAEHTPDLGVVVVWLAEFLEPLVSSLNGHRMPPGRWTPEHGWK